MYDFMTGKSINPPQLQNEQRQAAGGMQPKAISGYSPYNTYGMFNAPSQQQTNNLNNIATQAGYSVPGYNQQAGTMSAQSYKNALAAMPFNQQNPVGAAMNRVTSPFNLEKSAPYQTLPLNIRGATNIPSLTGSYVNDYKQFSAKPGLAQAVMQAQSGDPMYGRSNQAMPTNNSAFLTGGMTPNTYGSNVDNNGNTTYNNNTNASLSDPKHYFGSQYLNNAANYYKGFVNKNAGNNSSNGSVYDKFQPQVDSSTYFVNGWAVPNSPMGQLGNLIANNGKGNNNYFGMPVAPSYGQKLTNKMVEALKANQPSTSQTNNNGTSGT
jgi:hypothetical protein